MVNEMPKTEDLIKDRENLKQKVAAIQAPQNRDLEARVLGIENNRDETRKLEKILEEARKNCEYYEKLNKAGQLPEDENENYEKAKQIFWEIQAKIDEHDAATENAMAIPEVKDKVMEHAGEINERVDKEKTEKEKEKMLEEKYFQWYEKLADLAEDLNKKQKAEADNYDKAETKLVEKIQGSISDQGVKNELQDRLRYVLDENRFERFKEEISQYRARLGWTKFSEKGRTDSLINSIELKEMGEAIKHFSKFIKDEKLEGRLFGNFKECVWAILHGNIGGAASELKDLHKLQWEDPYIASDLPLNNAYKKANRLQAIDLSSHELERYILAVS